MELGSDALSSGQVARAAHGLFSLALDPPFLLGEAADAWGGKAGEGKGAEKAGRREGRGLAPGSTDDLQF